MDVRLRHYYRDEAEAIRRHLTLTIAVAVRAGMAATANDWQTFVSDLELTAGDPDDPTDTWELLKTLKRG